MTKIGIMSDTHSCWDGRYVKHFSDCDEIWHAGDLGDMSMLENLRSSFPYAVVRAVAGNIDPPPLRREIGEVAEFEVDGLRVWMTHIGGYPGRYAPGVMKLLSEKKINIFVSGHSHILKVMSDKYLGLLHINPGAAGTHGWQRERTLVRLTIKDGKPSQVEIITLSKKQDEEEK
ncbi:MAG: metallophosphatase family protein [Alloprevotella sp.]|nr:metallophosphatase family protein [Alloprevotella sp.]